MGPHLSDDGRLSDHASAQREWMHAGLAPHLARGLAEAYGVVFDGLDLVEQGRWIRMAEVAIAVVTEATHGLVDNLLDLQLDWEGELRRIIADLDDELARYRWTRDIDAEVR